MLDFMTIAAKPVKNGLMEIYPKFIITKPHDLMVRGGDFYAVWLEEEGRWSTEEQDCLELIDKLLDQYVAENKQRWDSFRVLHMWDAETGMIDRWHKFVQKQSRDSFHMLDEKIIFANDPVKKRDYSSKRLTYSLEDGDITAWNTIVDTLYSPEERHKIEWAIGSVVTGDSKKLQKFLVFYGAAGTGKSTIINIIQELFDGYYSVFDARALGSASNSFALEAFKNNPLVAIQHDGDLSRIEDNTRLNSLVSHEKMTVNEKFKGIYENRFKAFLFMGTNKPVKITDAKSGLIRRVIDVCPSGNKLGRAEYNRCVKQVGFELGGIAYHCKEVYLQDPYFYDDYIPTSMLGSTNDFYNFVEDCCDAFSTEDGVTLKRAWELYQNYVDEARVSYPLSKRAFKEELKNYFKEFHERFDKDNIRLRNYYNGFNLDKFDNLNPKKSSVGKTEKTTWIELKKQKSILDQEFADCPAQYANDKETPTYKWSNVKTTLSDLDTSKLHYVLPTEEYSNHIFIDFDLKNEKGEKDGDLNIAAASDWPKTYAELSKGGAGLHLHYIYDGDVNLLSKLYSDNIEVKTFIGNSALRRRLTKCNDLPIAHIGSGLPLRKEEKKEVLNLDAAQTEKGLRSTIIKCLRKEVHPDTASNVNFIKKILDDAYASGVHYDVSDLESDVIAFAASSTNQSEKCLKLTEEMKFQSEDLDPSITAGEKPIAFYDCEVFPNLFLVNYKTEKTDEVIRLVNPKPTDMEQLMKFRLIGFNCRDYDNHMIYACYMGYNNEQLYQLSQSIINGDKKEKKAAKFGNAYNLSYTDVYDFASSVNKMSLKKWEIELKNQAANPDSKLTDELRAMIKKIRHHELGLPWDKPVPEHLWTKVAEYCDDDVLATEALFYYLKADWTARQILADLAGMTVNDTTNTLTTKIIFGNNKKPQSEFNYRNLAEPVYDLDEETYQFLSEACPEMMEKTHGEAGSLLPYFPGYTFDKFKRESIYRGEVVGEGGFAQGFPGIYGDVALLDVASMHPHSAIAECLFGVIFTTAYRDVVEGRVDIKHQAWDELDHMLDGKLRPFIENVKAGEMAATDLANALKTAINSVYGLTSATFPNQFKDERNIDNIVAKRGALFMIDLKHAVEEKGYKVVHIKTDSIKIADASNSIIAFVMNFGKRYGYTFEHEATYDKMCLVNDAVYIAKYATKEKCELLYGPGYIPGDCKDHGGEWTATGTQFQVPYVFKTLFSKEPILFQDMCEVNSVKTAIYLDKNEGLPDVSEAEKELDKLESSYKKGLLSDTTFEQEGQRLSAEIEKGHNYIFVGKVGQFTPIKPGCGGAILVADRGEKYAAVTGTKGYRWLESDMVKELGKEEDIDRSYYGRLIDDAYDAIKEQCEKTYPDGLYGPDWFCSNDEYETKPFR